MAAVKLLLLVLSALPAAGCEASGDYVVNQDNGRATAVPPARDGDIAIREEFDAARRAGTVEAYDFFIARHPQHPLAEVARDERRRIAEGRPRR
jgi:hypothetical protein